MYTPGQKFVPSAKRENDIDRMLRDWRARSGSFARPDSATLEPGHVIAKNTSGAAIPFGGCSLFSRTAITNTEGTPRRDWDTRKALYTLIALQNINSNATPSIGGMAIALEPLADNALGPVAIAGPAICNVTATDVGYIRPAGATAVRDHWGFARILAYDSAAGFSLANLSDSRFQVFYQLTTAVASASATATLSPSFNSWSTTVHDPHGIASWQVAGDVGFVEWRGDRWCIVIPLCD